MMEEVGLSWLMVTVVPILILISIALNYRRAKQWDQKVREHGHVHCRACGFVGDLLVRAVSAGHSSSNLRLVCGKCNSSDWFVPEEDRLP